MFRINDTVKWSNYDNSLSGNSKVFPFRTGGSNSMKYDDGYDQSMTVKSDTVTPFVKDTNSAA